jgi:hypothetical protein
MTQWVAATWRSHRSPAKPFRDYEDADWRSLGHRGAPLKTCVAAACLLAQRESSLGQLEQALDYLLIGAVLFDHVRDWTDDLAAGRYNAFIAYVSGWPQTPDYYEANRRAVTQELVVGQVGGPYFQLLRCELVAARALAHQAGCQDLARYISWLRHEVISYSKGMKIRARDQLHRALEPLLETAETQVGK